MRLFGWFKNGASVGDRVLALKRFSAARSFHKTVAVVVGIIYISSGFGGLVCTGAKPHDGFGGVWEGGGLYRSK